MKFFRLLTAAVAVVLLAISFWVGPVAAQAEGGTVSMRSFIHVFLSLSTAWIILGAWVWFMAARLDRLVRHNDPPDR